MSEKVEMTISANSMALNSRGSVRSLGLKGNRLIIITTGTPGRVVRSIRCCTGLSRVPSVMCSKADMSLKSIYNGPFAITALVIGSPKSSAVLSSLE